MTLKRIRVLVVDDSALVRQVLAEELSRDPEIEVVGTASDPFIARDKILRDKPDVMILDIEMPRMDGLTFLRKLMKYHPLPVIILSSMTRNGTRIGVEAFERGALEVFAKPQGDSGLQELVTHLRDAVHSAAGARPVGARAVVPLPEGGGPIKEKGRPSRPTDRVIVMGASTGGTEALKAVLSALPADCPGVLAVIHMPEGFTASFAERLDQYCAIEVREAKDGDEVRSGLALIARGDHHLVLTRTGGRYRAQLRQGPLICRHRPSVEVLFQSAAIAAGDKALGVIMTGMGADGADGLLAMRSAGAHTIAQDEGSCVVYGMPKEAVARGAVEEVLPLDRIAGACIRWSGLGGAKPKE